MGWKLSSIFINATKQIDDIALFESLGFHDLKPIETKTLEEVFIPEDNELYIGNYKGNTIICAPMLPYTFLDAKLQKEESVLIETFPNSEISALMLHSVVNFWGFTLIKNGEKLRAKGGSSDDGIIIDFGEPLPEEHTLLKNAKMNDDGERVFILDDDPDEEYTEDQLGEDFIFQLSERYIGNRLDKEDDLLFKTEFRGYSFSNTNKSIEALEKIAKKSKWIKYIIYILLFFVIRFLVKYFLG